MSIVLFIIIQSSDSAKSDIHGYTHSNLPSLFQAGEGKS